MQLNRLLSTLHQDTVSKVTLVGTAPGTKLQIEQKCLQEEEFKTYKTGQGHRSTIIS